MKFGPGSAQQTEQPNQFRAFIIAGFQKGRLYVYRNAVFHQFRDDQQTLRRDFIGMDEMGGDFHAFATFLEFKIFSFQITQPLSIIR